ncbi:hypothetical protein H6F96_26370 [Microcoleus sp. FACHB-53]|nr:hypothetical protein [Microcoleus sp. FACHB-53]
MFDHFSSRCVWQKRVEQGAPTIAFTCAVGKPMKASKKQNLLVPQIDETLTPTATTIHARVCGRQASKPWMS